MKPNLSNIQDLDLVERFFGRRPGLWAFSLTLVTVVLFAWWGGSTVIRTSATQPIEIVSATYGESCREFTPAVGENLVAAGNVTSVVRSGCLVADNQCSFNYRRHWSDPAPGCEKDLSVLYRCPDDPNDRMAYVAAEATGKNVVLDCNVAFTPIRIVSATYGLNCSGFATIAQPGNLAREGNVTGPVQELCSGRNATDDQCTFTVASNHWGDPAQGCQKDFLVSFECRADPEPRSASIPAEAAGKTVTLDCKPRPLSSGNGIWHETLGPGSFERPSPHRSWDPREIVGGTGSLSSRNRLIALTG